MKITILQTELAKVLGISSHAVPTKPPNPILANLLLESDRNTQQLIITAFDLSFGIRAIVNCNVESSGLIAIRAKLLVEVVSQLPKSDITFELKDNVAVLTHSTGRCQIQTLSPNEFPALPDVDGIPVTLPVSKLQQLLKATLFAASHDQTKQVIAGVHFKFTAANCELAATDGHRLAVARVALLAVEPSTDTESVEATIPYQSLRELERLLNNVSKGCDCTLSIGRTQAIFDLPDVQVTTRLLEGQYPPYSSLIPQEFQYQFTLNKQTLGSAVARVAIVAESKNHTTKFCFNLNEKYVSISAESQANGSAVESVAIEQDSDCGDNFNLGLNILYLIDSLKHISASEIIIKANRPESPVIVTPSGSSFNSMVLLMPLQLIADEEETPSETTPLAETPVAEIPTQEIPEQKATQSKSNKKKPLAA
jgi:DNA polymerase-3 subunit beta